MAMNQMLKEVSRATNINIGVARASAPPPPASAAPAAPAAPAASAAPPAQSSPFVSTMAVSQPQIAFNPVAAAALNTSLPLGTILPGRPFVPFIPQFVIPKTTTQLAQSAIALLSAAAKPVLEEAVTTVKNANVAAGMMMNFLERKVIIREVLDTLARNWTDETRKDFAEAFRTTVDKTDVMDAIVSVAILNDPDLADEVMIENTSDPTDADLMENRAVVWQWPPANTQLQPPYVILLAVEHRDVAKAADIVESITGALTDHQGYKLPKQAVQKLRPGISLPVTATLPIGLSTLRI